MLMIKTWTFCVHRIATLALQGKHRQRNDNQIPEEEGDVAATGLPAGALPVDAPGDATAPLGDVPWDPAAPLPDPGDATDPEEK